METKRCSKCGEVKAVDAFGLLSKCNQNKTGRVMPNANTDGRRAQCNKCRSLATAVYQATHREQTNKKGYQWVKNNPEKRSAIRKAQRAKFAQAHPDLVKARRDSYRTENAAAIKLHHKQFREKHAESIREYKAARREVENAQERARNKALTLSYIKKLIARSVKATTATVIPELITVTRARLQMVRTMKQLKGAINEKRK